MRQQAALWYGDRLLTEVLVPPGTSDADVKALAISWHDRVPLVTDCPPFEHRLRLCRATVRRYRLVP